MDLNETHMEVDESLSHLFALRNLYGLHQSIIGYNASNTSTENACELLDRKALQLLKNLLDDDRQRLFESAQSKILILSRDFKSTHPTELNSHHEVVVSRSPKLSVSSNKAGSEYYGKQSSTKGGEITRRITDFELSNPSSNNNVTSSVGCSTGKKSDDVGEINDFSKEVAKAIKQIDSHVLALQILKAGTPVRNNDNTLFKALLERKKNRGTGESTWGGNALLSHLNESKSQPDSGATQRTSNVQGLRVPLHQNDDPTVKKDTTKNEAKTVVPPLVSSSDHPDQKLSRRLNRESNMKKKRKPLTRQIIMRPTVLDQIDKGSQKRKKTQQKIIMSSSKPSSSASSYPSSSQGEESESGSYLTPSSAEDDENERQSSSSSGRIGERRTKTNVPKERPDNRKSNMRKKRKPLTHQIIMRPTLLDQIDKGNQKRKKIQQKIIWSSSKPSSSSSSYTPSSQGEESESGSYRSSSQGKESESGSYSSSSQGEESESGSYPSSSQGNESENGSYLTTSSAEDDEMVKRNKKHGNQDNVENFQALVEGLMRHVGGHHSKEKPEVKIDTNKVLVKRIHLWQQLRRRKGMKLPNRQGRVKVVGFNRKTPNLKM
uniref:Uncharacterized protein n=1 Tax=Cannabis sativa TaxID=3483 RepID=A0A803QFZ0_CANSA